MYKCKNCFCHSYILCLFVCFSCSELRQIAINCVDMAIKYWTEMNHVNHSKLPVHYNQSICNILLHILGQLALPLSFPPWTTPHLTTAATYQNVMTPLTNTHIGFIEFCTILDDTFFLKCKYSLRLMYTSLRRCLMTKCQLTELCHTTLWTHSSVMACVTVTVNSFYCSS